MRMALRATVVLALVAFAPGLLEGFETPKAAVVRVAGLGLLAAVLASPRGLRALRVQILDFAILAWLGVEVVASAMSVAPRLSVFGDPQQHEGLLTSLALAGIYFSARIALANDARPTLHAWFAGAAIASLYALLQAAGLDPAPWIHTATIGTFVRPFGTMGHPNLLGVVTCAAGAAALALAMQPGRRWLYAALAILFAAATLVTFSRAAWLGLGVGAVIALALVLRGRSALPRHAIPIAAGALGAIVLATFASPLREPLLARLHDLISPASGSGRSRLLIWRVALEAWRERPWLGQGPDTFAITFTRLQLPEFWRLEWNHLAWHAHSIYLHALATRGLLGVAVGGVVALEVVMLALRAWRMDAATRGREGVWAPLTAAISALAALAVAGVTGALGIGGALSCAILLALLTNAANPAVVVSVPSGPAAPAPPERSRRRVGKGTDRSPSIGSVPAAIGLAVAAVALVFSWLDLRALAATGIARRWIDGAGARSEMASAQVWGVMSSRVAAASASAPWDDAAPRTQCELELARAGGDPSTLPILRRAESAARVAVARVPLRSANHRRLGAALALEVALGDSARGREAAAEFERAVALAPNDAFLLKEWTRAQVILGRTPDAVATADRLVTLYPDRGMALEVLGETLAAAGNREGARQVLDRAVAATWEEDFGARVRARRMLDTLGVRR